MSKSSPIDLSKISLSKLLKEVNRRKSSKVSEYIKIKSLAAKNGIKLAACLTDDGYSDEKPYIMLGVLEKDEFEDFYYGSGLEYGEFLQYIPEKFCEACESTYEYSPEKKLTREEYIKEAFSILSKCGYTRLPDCNS